MTKKTTAPSMSPPERESPWPGLGASLVAALVGLGISRMVPALSALLVAIVLGVAVGNLLPTREPRLHPGVAIAAKQLLRAGIVVLGLKVSLTTIIGLGWPVVALVVAIVTIGIAASYGVGKALGLEDDAAMLIACGFSICGAAAVAAADGVIQPRRENVATAIALVVLFGTLMIGVVPVVVSAAHLPATVAAIWAGGGTHEVAQVVAIGGILGGGTLLSMAVVVKLARVMMLAPVMVGLSLWQRRRVGHAGQRPPLVQPFVVGFLSAVLVRTAIPLPAEVLAAPDVISTLLMGMAMFALGLGVNRRALAQASGKAVTLGVASTLVVNALALGGALLIG